MNLRKIVIAAIAVPVILLVVAAALGGGGKSSAPVAPRVAASPAATTQAAPAPVAPSYTEAQQQAIESAQQYLNMGNGFSRKGLIQQLDSSAGEGFSKSLAVFAVNHVKVSWYHQAVLSAKGYMAMGGFSYAGLIQQLDSADGEQFTYAQAVYAAKAVGL